LIPAPGQSLRAFASSGEVVRIEDRPSLFAVIAEAIDEKEIEHFIAPVARRWMVVLAPRQEDVVANARGSRL
jgi:hypothetical protein